MVLRWNKQEPIAFSVTCNDVCDWKASIAVITKMLTVKKLHRQLVPRPPVVYDNCAKMTILPYRISAFSILHV